MPRKAIQSFLLPQIKTDLESLIHALTPVLYFTKTGAPKPPFLAPTIIQQLTDKVHSFLPDLCGEIRNGLFLLFLARHVEFVAPLRMHTEQSRWLHIHRWEHRRRRCFTRSSCYWVSTILWWDEESEEWKHQSDGIFSQCEFEKTQTRWRSLCSSTRLQKRRSRQQQFKSSVEERRCSRRKHWDIELSCTIDVWSFSYAEFFQ